MATYVCEDVSTCTSEVSSVTRVTDKKGKACNMYKLQKEIHVAIYI